MRDKIRKVHKLFDRMTANRTEQNRDNITNKVEEILSEPRTGLLFIIYLKALTSHPPTRHILDTPMI